MLQANVLNNKNVLESTHVYNIKPIIMVFGYVSAFRFPAYSFISCLYDFAVLNVPILHVLECPMYVCL